MQQKKNRKRLAITVALVACLAAVAGFGTLAWLTAQDEASNVFTIGSFSDPTKDPDTDEGDHEDKDEGKDNITDGYLFETTWVENSKLTAGTDIPKNPNVGIGPNSDSAYIFVYVHNKTLEDSVSVADNAPYFTLGREWVAVDGEADSSTAKQADGVSAVQDAYTGGLFMYVWNGDKDSGSALTTGMPAVLTADKVKNVYTGEVFEDVTMPALADFNDYLDSPKMDVYAYIYGYNAEANQDADESGNYADGTAGAALKAAKDWAADLEKKFDEENQGQ